jgi:type II secretory pathway pseudopilin PulG
MRTERRTTGAEAAFTLTELALCIAVIGIALTAIIGVLPSGLNVQKQNREETLVAQDAQFLIETVRSGSMSIPDLIQQVDFIHWRRTGAEAQDIYFRGPNYTETLPGRVIPLTASWQVTALLSTPRFEVVRRGLVTNDVTAQFRSFSSPFSEKAYRDDGLQPSSGDRTALSGDDGNSGLCDTGSGDIGIIHQPGGLQHRGQPDLPDRSGIV